MTTMAGNWDLPIPILSMDQSIWLSSTIHESLVDVSYCLGVVDGVGAQHPEPVVARFGFDLLFINKRSDYPSRLLDSDGNLCYRPDSCPHAEVAPLSARQSPPDRAHSCGALLH